LPIQETQTITKETQKAVLKVICESPTLTIEELSTLLKSRGNKISQEEILQVLHSISPSKNWHRATQEDVQKEVLEYLWTLEAQILFLLPTKQKETTIAEFNQIRLQNKQSKVLKDIIRHLQSILTVDGKNLAKFRKFQKDLSFQNDIDINIQTSWLIRRITSDLNITLVTSCQNLPTLIANQLRERFPTISEKAGKTLQRICEKFVEKYFPKNISENKLKEIVTSYQTIFHNYKKGSETETSTQSEFYDQNKLTQNIIETLYEVQNIVKESHEGGALSKLFAGKLRNKEGIIKKIDEVINSLNQVCELSNKSNKVSNEKTLLVQKLQSDYENIVLVKSQLENDLYTQKEKIAQLEEKVHLGLERDSGLDRDPEEGGIGRHAGIDDDEVGLPEVLFPVLAQATAKVQAVERRQRFAQIFRGPQIGDGHPRPPARQKPRGGDASPEQAQAHDRDPAPAERRGLRQEGNSGDERGERHGSWLFRLYSSARERISSRATGAATSGSRVL